MKIEQWEKNTNGWVRLSEIVLKTPPQFILVFGAIESFLEENIYEEVREIYSSGDIVMCSTSGEIRGSKVIDNSVQVSALSFSSTNVRTTSVCFGAAKDSYRAGLEIVKKFPQEKLCNLMIFSDGHLVNGSDLVEGIKSIIPENILVTGGLAGGGINFTKTLVGLNSKPKEGSVVAVGFYGNNLEVGFGCQGGWESFGPERLVTKSDKNILHELDDQNALELYKNYLGNEAKKLPSSALLFPLNMYESGSGESVVRTILSIDKMKGTMTFAGNIPEGSKVRLMQANFDKLVDGALHAAINSLANLKADPQFVILISCVGRKLVLGPRTEEEAEVIAWQFTNTTKITGFYSNGEISPIANTMSCGLHNQTMTITTFFESEENAQTS